MTYLEAWQEDQALASKSDGNSSFIGVFLDVWKSDDSFYVIWTDKKEYYYEVYFWSELNKRFECNSLKEGDFSNDSFLQRKVLASDDWYPIANGSYDRWPKKHQSGYGINNIVRNMINECNYKNNLTNRQQNILF